MKTKQADFIAAVLGTAVGKQAVKPQGEGSAPSNIALVKYWGKRDTTLNLPLTDSISISLGDLGARTFISEHQEAKLGDQLVLNGEPVDCTHPFHQRLVAFLDYFRPNPNVFYRVESHSDIPIAAGLASSACGFAALVLALNDLYGWSLSHQKLSMLARFGSGSAARSLEHGFVHWHAGTQASGLDSFANALDVNWPGFCIGLLIFESGAKKIGSKQGMIHTVNTSPLYAAWPDTVEQDLTTLLQALTAKDFHSLGEVAEGNAMAMHATMESARPALCYSTTTTLEMRQRVWQLREQGLALYFTQDAGPNLKLLFEEKDLSTVQKAFSDMILVRPFDRQINQS